MAAKPSAFSVYASNFLARSFAPQTASDDSQPLFFSVTEGSHLGEDDRAAQADGEDRQPGGKLEDSEMLDDDGLPHLVGSDIDYDQSLPGGLPDSFIANHAGPSNYMQQSSKSSRPPDDPFVGDDDPEDDAGYYVGEIADSIPLIASETKSRLAVPAKTTPGWLAHVSQSRRDSPSPPSSDASSSPPLSPTTEHSEPPDYLLGGHLSPPPTRTALSESLLPRDGISRSLFTLPDPNRIPRRKYNDSIWTSVWCTALLVCGVGFIVVLFVTVSPKRPSTPETPPTPYLTITHAIPLLMFLTMISSAVSYLHLLLLRFAVRPVLMGTALAIPVSLVIGSLWAFAASFYWEEGVESTWGETVGLRLFSVVPLVLAYFSARSLYFRQKSLLRTVEVVELSTSVILEHQPILLLSLGLLLVSFIASLPFLSLIIRLTLIGYYSSDHGHTGWHIRGYAGWLAFLATCIWIWSWAVVRGVLKVSVGGVVGSWYYSRDPDTRRLTPLEATQAAFGRASGASFGSICVATMVLALTQSSIFVLRSLRKVTTPPQLAFLSFLHPLELISSLISILDSLSAYALVYVGLTGDPFMASAKRAKDILNRGGKGGRAKGTKSGDYLLLSHLLTLSSLSIAALAAVGGYIFAAHSLSGPANAPLVALLTGGVTFLTINFGVGLGEDAADALYLCYRIDLDTGMEHRPEVLEAFEGKRQPPRGEP